MVQPIQPPLNYWAEQQLNAAFPASYSTPASYGPAIRTNWHDAYVPQTAINTGLRGAPGGGGLFMASVQDGMDFASNVGNNIVNGMQPAYQNAIGAAQGLGTGLVNTMAPAYQNAYTALQGLGNDLVDAFTPAYQNASNFAQTFGNNVMETGMPYLNQATDWLSETGTNIYNQAGTAMENYNNHPLFDQIDPKTGMKIQGKFMPTVQALNSAFGAYSGLKQMSMAKEQMNFQRSAWQQQFDLQKGEFDYARKRRDQRQATYNEMKKRA